VENNEKRENQTGSSKSQYNLHSSSVVSTDSDNPLFGSNFDQALKV
jgi:hypothetical protein